MLGGGVVDVEVGEVADAGDVFAVELLAGFLGDVHLACGHEGDVAFCPFPGFLGVVHVDCDVWRG